MSWSRYWFWWRVKGIVTGRWSLQRWRDVDHETNAYGVTIGPNGAQLDAGRRTYRVTWFWRDR